MYGCVYQTIYYSVIIYKKKKKKSVLHFSVVVGNFSTSQVHILPHISKKNKFGKFMVSESKILMKKINGTTFKV